MSRGFARELLGCAALGTAIAACGGTIDEDGREDAGGALSDAAPGGDGTGEPEVREDDRPPVQPFEAGLRFTRTDGEIHDGPFSITGPVIASGSGKPPAVVSLSLGEARGSPLQAAWVEVADASTRVVLAYALPWAVPAPAAGETITLAGDWDAQPSEFVPPMGHVELRDAAGALQLLFATAFVPPEVAGLDLARGSQSGDLTLCEGPTHMYALAVTAGEAAVEVPYGDLAQVGPFVVLHGGLLEYTTTCPEFSPRTTVSLAAVRGRLADLEAAGGGPCGAASCSTREVCDAPACDPAAAEASCRSRPALADCPASPSPVCGCDGVPYESACVAAHRGAGVAEGDTSCLETCENSVSAGRCLRTWSCGGHDLGAFCFRTAEAAETAQCECTVDGVIVDRVPYTPERCTDADMRAACRFRAW